MGKHAGKHGSGRHHRVAEARPVAQSEPAPSEPVAELAGGPTAGAGPSVAAALTVAADPTVAAEPTVPTDPTVVAGPTAEERATADALLARWDAPELSPVLPPLPPLPALPALTLSHQLPPVPPLAAQVPTHGVPTSASPAVFHAVEAIKAMAAVDLAAREEADRVQRAARQAAELAASEATARADALRTALTAPADLAAPAAPVLVGAMAGATQAPVTRESTATAPPPTPAQATAPAQRQPASLRPDLPPVPAFVPDERASGAAPVGVAPSADVQRAHARKRRTRAVGRATAVGLVAALAVAGGAAALLVHGSEKPAPHRVVVAAPVRSQHTLLFALGDPTGDETALLASDPKSGTASVTLMPSRVVTTVAGNGQVPLGKAVALPDVTRGQGAVSDLLGVTVDATWRVSPVALASLIDGLGGVTVDVDTQVIQGGTVVLQPGDAQHLSGQTAVLYAQYLASGEDESARLARVQRVLSALLAEANAPSLASAIGALGGGSESSLSPAALATMLRQTAAGHGPAGSAGPLFSLLPVTSIDTGGSNPVYRVDPAALAAYVSANLAASVPAGAAAGALRVFIYSGTLQYGLGTAARADLVKAGLSFVGSSNLASPSTAASVVLVPDGSDTSRARGERVAKALGLPVGSVQVSEVSQDVADVIVIAGPDFRY